VRDGKVYPVRKVTALQKSYSSARVSPRPRGRCLRGRCFTHAGMDLTYETLLLPAKREYPLLRLLMSAFSAQLCPPAR
jgi:hypothetical protein